jgi:hypothetical protein
MASRNPGGFPAIGKRWPYKALNLLPEKRAWSYLRRKSGADLPTSAFALGPSLTGSKRVLVALPDDFQANLVAFPVIRSLARERAGTEFMFLIEQRLTGFLAALLGSDRVIGIRGEELYWGEPHFLELRRIAADFRPDVSVNLRETTSPLLHFILRAAQAPIRIQAGIGAAPPEGFANIYLRPGEPLNRLRAYAQVAGLWDAAEIPVPVKWARLGAGPENLKEAEARLRQAGLDPAATKILLWQHGFSQRERELLVSENGSPDGKRAASLLVVNGGGPLFATPAPPPDLLAGRAALTVDSTGLLLGLFACTRRSVGVNGPLLHLASLADTDVEAHFAAEDAAWDTSWLNARLKVLRDSV